jgi:enoyl-CoA hydratase/carnithine racemase
VTLNRPKSLNALTYEMASELEAALRRWATDASVAIVLVNAAGDRAFCAGGDIQDLYASGKAGDFDYGRRFWADEYRLNAFIANYPKPYVAIMDGIVMGGGVGVSAHGSHRVVTERTVLAMPECSIGLIPDVGASWRLAHAPGHVGDYVGLTGTRLGPGDAIYAGFADHFVSTTRLEEMKGTLVETGDAAAIADFAEAPTAGELAEHRRAIDAAFGRSDVLAIIAALEADGSGWAGKTLAALRRGSPLSVACAFEVIRRARQAARIEDALAMEYRFASRCMEHGDFLEGIRAAIIDKDRKPAWTHGRIEEVPPDGVAAMLAPAAGGDPAF